METQRLRIATTLAIIALLMSSNCGFSASSNSCYKQIASCAKGCMSAYCPNGKGVPGGCGPQWSLCVDKCSAQLKVCLK